MRTLKVTGTGRLSIEPDLIVITVGINSVDPDYEKAMETSGAKLNSLKTALAGVGFGEKALKTADFRVDTENESICDENGRYRTVFAGYRVYHGLRLEFDFDSERLAAALSAIAGCMSEPNLGISFTVKDREGVYETLLENAARNARRKAEVLAEASGVVLGALVGIEYNRSDIPLVSPSTFGMADNCLKRSMAAGIEINPDDIKVSDSAVFVWEISDLM
ncbi:MAG: SIMPL domain-containing protein [Clostridia bacterium]|nr:SIMPL domain-containing protein [Clostridia bacterium]